MDIIAIKKEDEELIRKITKMDQSEKLLIQGIMIGLHLLDTEKSRATAV